MKGKEDSNFIIAKEEKVKVPTEIPDTIKLIADYRDPFLGKNFVQEDDSKFKIQNSRLKVENVPEPVKVVAVWPAVFYHGLVKRNGNQKTVGFLNVNGKSFFVQGGEVAGEVQVGKLWKDSLEILFGKDKRVFRK
jgi:hypothetical protein